MAGTTATISLTAFRADWLTHMPMRAMCERYTISRDQVIRLKHVWDLPPRHDRRFRQKPGKQADPTPAQIKAACLLLQSKWDEKTREDRRVQKTQHVTLRIVPIYGEENHPELADPNDLADRTDVDP